MCDSFKSVSLVCRECIAVRIIFIIFHYLASTPAYTLRKAKQKVYFCLFNKKVFTKYNTVHKLLEENISKKSRSTINLF